MEKLKPSDAMDANHGLERVLSMIDNVHLPSGPIYSEISKTRAQLNLENDELTQIYYLKESHAPDLRCSGVINHSARVFNMPNSIHLDTEHFNYNCNKLGETDNINRMLQQVSEMPQEWTLVQITSMLNPLKNSYPEDNKNITNGIFITVFQGGKKNPFCVPIPVPMDHSGSPLKILEELDSIMIDLKKTFSVKNIVTEPQKLEYIKQRQNLNNRMMNVVKDVQNIWLGGWRCLLLGRLTDDMEEKVEEILNSALRNLEEINITEKKKCILKCLIRGSNIIKPAERIKILKYCFQRDLKLVKTSLEIGSQATKELSVKAKFHPVILIIDEKLDTFPWEMIDLLINNPVSRMPSLHFTSALFKRYQDRIVDGILRGFNADNGRYIINPDVSLNLMSKRIGNLISLRTPTWTGLINKAPTSSEMQEFLTESDIFTYHGHGNGSQYLPFNKIEKLLINSIVFLLGCSSTRYLTEGPKIEMFNHYNSYLLACNPCTVGCLWLVSDTDMDCFSALLLDHWIPPTKGFLWKNINRNIWVSTGEIVAKTERPDPEELHFREPELLRAVCYAKKCMLQYTNKAAIVIRGLPVSL